MSFLRYVVAQKSLTICALLLLLVATAVTAAVPSMMSYQGRLSDSAGAAVSDGNYTAVFSLFGQAAGGTALWTETNAVRVTGGVFATLLGKTVPVPDSAFGNLAWLEIEINGGVLTPRTQMVATPYAFRSRMAEGVPPGTIDNSMLGPASVTGVALADSAVGTTHLTEASVTAAKLAPESVDSGKIVAGGVAYANLAADAVTQLTKQARTFDAIYSVTDYGAIGDGQRDDTLAFKKSLNAAASRQPGAKVLVPPGNYRIRSTLTVENTLLMGLVAGGWPADTGPLPHLKVDFTNGPCVIAMAGASLHGLSFEYDHGGQVARQFGPTIRVSGVGVSLTNLRLNEPYEGIIADGNSNVGRLNVANNGRT